VIPVLRDRSVASAVAQNLGVRIALIVLTFGTGIIVARSLAPVGRGEVAAVALWPLLLAGMATLGVPTAVNYQTSRRVSDAGRLFFAGLVIAVGAGLCAMVVGVLCMPLLLRGYTLGAVNMARMFMILAPQCLVLFVVRSHLEASGEYTRSIMGQLMSNALTLVGLVVVRLAGHLTPDTAVLCYYVPGAIWTVVFLVELWPRITVDFELLSSDMRGLLTYGIRSYGTDVITALSSQVDLAVIVAFLSPTALGLYSVSLTVARLLNIVQQSLVTVIFPHASGLDRDRALAVVARAARLSTVLSIAFGLGLLAVVPVMLPLVYGPAFAGALIIMPILIVEAILSGLASVLMQAFLCTGRPAVVTAIQSGWLVCALALLVMLVPRMQTSGAAIALAGASIVRLVFVGIAYQVFLGRQLPLLLPTADDVAFVRAKFHFAPAP